MGLFLIKMLKSFETFYLVVIIISIICNKCIESWNFHESVASAYTSTNFDQIELNFSILEGVPIGTLIGVIKSTNSSINTQPPYLIVPVPGIIHKTNSSNSVISTHSGSGSGVDTDLNIDQSTGEIRTAVQLDREQRNYYSFIAIPLTGANIKVTITIEDVNDNSPQFPTDEIDLEFPENSKPRDVKRTLPPARDIDLGQFGTQKYRIVSGNIGNAFRLLSHREKDDVLYLDLQVNGALDRETISSYTLVIEALDGGQPQLSDEMTVRIAILDHNDCEPVFSQSHYYGNVAENVTLGTSLLRVTATDNDQGENGLITYSIHSKNSAMSSLSTYFGINKNTGWIFVAKPLDFESKEIHELVVIARDSGAQPLETSAFVSIRVTDVNDNQPTISLLFLTENAKPEIPENAKIGDLVARISVNDADSSDLPIGSESNGDAISGLSVSLAGNDGKFGLKTQDTIIYLIVVTGTLDRETRSKYTLTVIVTDQGSPPLNTTSSFELEITDINDNPPYFESDTYHVTLPEAADIGSSVFRMKAIDPDSDSKIIYSFLDKGMENSSTSKWFTIDSRSGLITTQSQVDCETDPTPKLIILASDTMATNGYSASATLIVSISDINDNEPIFDQSFYNITVREDEPVGNCILKISASDPDCGFNAMVNYTTMNAVMSIMATNINSYQQDFTIHPITGQLCIARQLDYESRNSYDIPVLATDRGGLSTTAMIKVQVVDTNDNYPTFYPREYKISVRENIVPIEKPRFPGDKSGPTPLVIVAATDQDSSGHPFGTITYAIKEGNEEEAFEIQEKTGKIFIIKPLSSTKPLHKLTIVAKDGGNRESKIPAIVHVSVLPNGDPNLSPPIFTQRQYNFKVSENVKPGTNVGTVSAKNEAKDSSNITFSIYSGDPDGYFTIDPRLGIISVKSNQIDHEKHDFLLLNIQAFFGRSPGPYRYGHTQVNITIIDENDNSPIFVTNNLKLSVPENTYAYNVTILVAHALDFDSGIFGEIRYSLTKAEPSIMGSPLPFTIDQRSGAVTLNSPLDYEQTNQYKLRISATDGGNLSSELLVDVLIQDANDNEPVFTGKTSDQKPHYKVNVLENSAVNSHFFQVKATDADTGNNARLTYSLVSNGQSNQPFGIFPNNGILYVKEQLDRETVENYEITIKVTDHGSPLPLSKVSVMAIAVIDVNDNRPYWVESSYVFTIVENAAVGTLIGKITASDPDIGNNASLRYNISDSQISELSAFQLNPITGEIYLKSTIDRELKDRYEFHVEVRDQGTPQPLYSEDKAIVSISVLDVNDNRPNFEMAEETKPVTVSLGSPSGTKVITVKAYDPDFGDNGTIYYSFVEEDNTFEIDRITGTIATKINIKEIASHKLSLLAIDGGGKRSKVKILNIDVVQNKIQNFNYETADMHTINVMETVMIGQEVGSFTLQAANVKTNVDVCPNGLSTYYNTLSNENMPFLFDSNNGHIVNLIVSNNLDFEKKNKYSFIVCVDWGQCSLAILDNESVIRGTKLCKQYIKIIINILDNEIDCNPFPMQSNRDLYEIKIPLNDINRYRRITDVLYLNGTNCDNIKYEITSPLIQEEVLKRLFSINGNVLEFRPFDQTMIKKFLHEEFVLTLLAKKSEQIFRSIPVRVRMLSSDKRIGNIGFINDKYLEMDEDCCKVGSNILQTRINVSHEDFIIKYELNNYNVNNEAEFTLNPETGFLSLNREFDWERKQEYKVNITAFVHDIKGPLISVSTIITIKVLNCNDEAPVFVRKSYEKEVLENVNINVLLLQVEAKDSDDFGHSNLTYLISEGYHYSEYFSLNKRNGELKLIKALDREEHESFDVPIYAFDEDFKHFALTYARIKLIDVNDNIPYFVNTNYEIKIPESISPGTLFHTIVAIDKDLHGLRASKIGLHYRILSGNMANKFSLHAQRGDLSTNAALDREKQNMYQLVIEVSDSLYSSTCNITIELMDVNDNAPVFDKSNYYAIIDNTIGGHTSVVTVRAIDSDGDPVLYSINTTNEFSSYFHMDSKTGEITTHTPSLIFLHESSQTNVFNFDVLAVEVGSAAYASHASKATVHVTLLNNLNHFMSKLKSYPYIISIDGVKDDFRVGNEIGVIEVSNTQPSAQNDNFIFRVVNNGDGYHSFMDYFNIHSQSGAIVVKRPLNYNYYEAIIEVSRGPNNLLASRSLLQVFIGGIDENKKVNVMPFKVDLKENMPIGTEVINLGIQSRIYHQKYIYSFAYSNVNYSYFSLDSNTGVISLQEQLDYETNPSSIELIIFARKPHSPFEGNYFNVTIEVINVDDNAPQFTQKHYISTVKEGEHTGSFVAQISALDIDNIKEIKDGHRSGLTYHILEGNHDNAFIIDPPGSGIIRTNIVLDREIRDHYFLKIVANDAQHMDGLRTSEPASNFQLSSHCTLEIIVIDVNDNVPVFPPYQELNINEEIEVGSIISTLTANDVDTFPMLTYYKQRTNQLSESEDLFDIGLYTGKITLKSPLTNANSRKVENMTNQYYLHIASSDSLHTVETQVLINVKRSASLQTPVFANNSNFYVELNPEEYNCVLHLTNCEIFRVKVEENKLINKKIVYSFGLESGKNGFYIDQNRGIIYNNKTLKFRNSKLFYLTVFAKYSGNDLQSQSSVLIRVLGIDNYYDNKRDKTFNIEADISQIGATILKLPKLKRNYAITAGNANKNFMILRGNELVLTNKPLKEEYNLRITPISGNQNNSIIANVKIKSNSEDKNSHNAFKSTIFDVELNENEPIGTEVQTLKPISTKERIKYQIFSGNELSHFRIDETNGIIYVNENINYENIDKYRLGVMAENFLNDSQVITSFSIVNINLININEHCPKFPISHYKTIIDENVAIGSKVIKLNAFDLDSDKLNYTIIKLIDAMSPFTFDYKSGYLVTNDLIDYESIEFSPPIYKLIVRAIDTGIGDMQCNSIETLLEIQIGSVDEYSPRFTSESYEFKVTTNIGVSQVKVGQVLASDADSGPDGKVIYTLRSSSPTNSIEYFNVNSTSGMIYMTTSQLEFQRHFSLIISATSGRPHSLSALTVVEINLSINNDNPDINGVTKAEDNANSAPPNVTSLPGWILFLIVLLMLITVVLLVSIIVIRLHQHQQQQQLMSGHVRHMTSHNIGSLLRKIGPVSGTDPNLATYHSQHTSHYGSAPPAPPCYNDVTLSSSAVLSNAEGHSASSGRGSAEDEDEVEADLDDVDEEIRMINEGSNYYGDGDESNEDITTTAEYLARLGVINHDEDEHEESSIALEDEEEDDVVLDELGNINSPRFNSVRGHHRNRIIPQTQTDEWPSMCGSLSSIVHSEEELSGSYNWDYLQHWGPKYQPLASVFAEIARLKATNGEQEDINISTIEAQMMAENGSTRSSSTASSSNHHKSPHHHHLAVHMSQKVAHSSPSTLQPSIQSCLQSLSPLSSSQTIPSIQENIDLDNDLTVDEEIRI